MNASRIVNGSRVVFWNVDTQYDFMRNDESFQGSLAIPGAREIEGNLERLTKLANAMLIMVVNTADWHNEQTKEISDTPDFKTTFPKHCMQRTKGADYIPATAPRGMTCVVDWQTKADYEKLKRNLFHLEICDVTLGGDEIENIILYKDHFDIFQGNQNADNVVKILNPEIAVVYGVATNVCVNYAVLGLLKRGVKVYVPTDAIKELPGLPLEEVLDNWKEKGAVLIKVDGVRNIINGLRESR